MVPHSWSPSDVVMVLTAIFTGICSVIAAWKATKSEKKSEIIAAKADDNASKLNTIHSLTNGNLTRTQIELEAEKRRNSYLEKLVVELTDGSPPGTLEKAKKTVESKQAKIGKRRKTDNLEEMPSC